MAPFITANHLIKSKGVLFLVRQHHHQSAVMLSFSGGSGRFLWKGYKTLYNCYIVLYNLNRSLGHNFPAGSCFLKSWLSGLLHIPKLSRFVWAACPSCQGVNPFYYWAWVWFNMPLRDPYWDCQGPPPPPHSVYPLTLGFGRRKEGRVPSHPHFLVESLSMSQWKISLCIWLKVTVRKAGIQTSCFRKSDDHYMCLPHSCHWHRFLCELSMYLIMRDPFIHPHTLFQSCCAVRNVVKSYELDLASAGVGYIHWTKI